MRDILFLFCLLIAAAPACSIGKTVSVNAERRGAPVSPSSSSAAQPEQEQKTFGGEAEPAPASAGLTGTYEYKGGRRSNEIRVLQISENIIKVSFLGNSEFESQSGPMANSGVIAARKIQLENGSRALLTADDAPDCTIILIFKGNSLDVRQNQNDCGFPNGVSATGSYRKTSSRAPTFDFDAESGDTLPEAILEKPTGDVQDDTARRIRFSAGESSAVVRGEISGGVGRTYLIGARAGQTMTVKVIDGGANGDVVFEVIAPDGTRLGGDRMHDDWSRRLPKSGDYVITVSAMESENADYKLQISIR